MKKPTKELKKIYNTDYSETSIFSSNARLLQSIWRTGKGYDFEKYGNFLKEDFAKESGTNFLTQNIFNIVKDEIANKHIERKVIKEPRIWNNLLSSQPLAFNLFGELKINLDLATKVFQDLYPERNIQKVTEIKFEYSPGRKDPKYTGDSSAFDVFIEYLNNKNEECFFGIEVKYAENLNDEPSTHKENYEFISKASKIIDLSKLEDLKQKPIQQIWRDHLLTMSLFITNKDYKIGDFIYLYPSKNIECVDGIEKYSKTFNSNIENHFLPLTIEKMVDRIKNYCNDNWISDFQDRYLTFEKIPS